MDVINEKGVIYVVSRAKSTEVGTEGLWIPVGVRPFYYTKVVWMGLLKFAFGCWDSDKGIIEEMVELSTGGVAVFRNELPREEPITIDRLINKFQEKLVRHGAECAERVVENFKQNYTIQLWQINLWAL